MIFKILEAEETAAVIECHLCPPKHLYTIHSSIIQMAQNYKQFKRQ